MLPPLLDAAATWLRAHDRDRMYGPMDFSINDECGVLIEGYEREPFIRQPWHPPYYRARCEEAGLEKAVDLFMYELEIADRSKILPIVFKLAAEVESRHGIRIRQDDPALAAARPGPLRRGLQRGLERQLGLRALLQARPRLLRPGDATRVRPQLVHGRRDRRRRDGGGRDHRAGRQPGAQEDERAAAAARVVALPAPGEDDRPRPGRLPRRQAGLPAHGRRRRALRRALRHREPGPAEVGRDGLDPRDQPQHEPRDGGDGRPHRAAFSGLRTRFCRV